MHVLLVNTYDSLNGSARAAYRLHQGLRQASICSQMLVQKKLIADPTVIGSTSSLAQKMDRVRLTIENLPLRLYRHREAVPYSLEWFPDRVYAHINRLNPDVVNLHWVQDGYLQIESIAKLRRPIVWTMHDMWHFTGGCYYSGDCDRYLKRCGSCPQLGSRNDQDLSRWMWQRKAKAWEGLNLTFVTPSSWLAECARESALLKNQRIEVIPNGLDLKLYQPTSQSIARKTLNLPLDRKLVLFGAVNATQSRRKGFQFLQPALQQLANSSWQGQIELVVFGANPSADQPDLGFKTHYLGKVEDEQILALAYAAADVFVAPSLQDNLPNTLVEAIACGTPCVAFKIGGIPDIIEHQQNGYLAHPYEVEDLAQGIAWVVENADRHQMLSHHARQKAEQEFTLERQASAYAKLFHELVERQPICIS